MNDKERLALAERAIHDGAADGIEALVSEQHNSLTRFTHNSIHQNLDAAQTLVQIRAVVDGRAGWACTNGRDDADLTLARNRAIAQARFAPKPVVPVRLPDKAAYMMPERSYDAATADTSPSARGEAARKIFAVAEQAGAWAAGYVATSASSVVIANSNGVRAAFSGTSAVTNTKCVAPIASGYAEAYSRRFAELDTADVGARAAAKAKDAGELGTPDVGDWTVVVEPPALGELIAFLLPHFSAQRVYEGASFLADGLGRQYMGENVTLLDDYAHPLFATCPFDGEGSPTERVTLIENGIARDFVTDMEWAERLERRNTGHYISGGADGPYPRAVVVEPGKHSREELIASTKRGILISRFWYIRVVDQRKAIVTGMTRDGTFLIEDGKLKGGLKNLRFNVRILDLLSSCELSDEAVRTGGYAYGMVCPTAKFDRFSVSSVTSY
ncbi:MAG TPA: TldD/PmbA family protein [Candidatus Acidoferrales bacterium]|nr:TldD/PmbA family protein [Candidatus Acidoferrales bacterium]